MSHIDPPQDGLYNLTRKLYVRLDHMSMSDRAIVLRYLLGGLWRGDRIAWQLASDTSQSVLDGYGQGYITRRAMRQYDDLSGPILSQLRALGLIS